MSNFNSREERVEALRQALRERIVVLDGAMGTMIQRHTLEEADYRGERFADWHCDVKGNSDLLVLPAVVRTGRRGDLNAATSAAAAVHPAELGFARIAALAPACGQLAFAFFKARVCDRVDRRLLLLHALHLEQRNEPFEEAWRVLQAGERERVDQEGVG